MSVYLMMLGVAGVFLLTAFTLAWLIQLKTKNGAIADVIWGLSFPIAAVVYFYLAQEVGIRQIILLLLVSLWGLRLAIYLFGRTIGAKEDARYTALRELWGKNQNLYMLRFFYFQALLALVLSLPFVLIMNNHSKLSLIEITGGVVWLIGLTGETIADNQLKVFKANANNKGRICNHGLWFYSRHPNYFFEWLVWVAYFLIALPSDGGWISFICPLAMLYFLLKVTGIPYTEAHMLKSKGEVFARYQETTSAFFPLPKKVKLN